MAPPKRNRNQLKIDRVKILKWYCLGYSTAEIKNKLNEENKNNGENYELSINQIYYDVKYILKETKEHRLSILDYYVDKELRAFEIMEKELWEAWEESKGCDENEEPNKCGEVKYLREIKDIINKKILWLGLSQSVTTKADNDDILRKNEMSNMKLEDVEKEIKRLSEAIGKGNKK